MERQTTTENLMTIAEVGDARVQLVEKTGTYIFNGKTPREIPAEFYEKIYKRFEGYLLIQLKERLTLDEVDEYIKSVRDKNSRLISASQAHRIHYLLSKRDGVLSEVASAAHDDILNIFSAQKIVLNQMLLKLYEVKDSLLTNTAEELIIVEPTESVESNLIHFDGGGKVTFNLSKKETLMFFYVLEKEGIIQFESDEKRRIFLESNFNYTEQRNNPNRGNPIEITGAGSELANFKSVVFVDSNNKTLDSLLKRLKESIHLFEFKK